MPPRVVASDWLASKRVLAEVILHTLPYLVQVSEACDNNAHAVHFASLYTRFNPPTL